MGRALRGLGYSRGGFFLCWWCDEINGGRPEPAVDGAEGCFENLSRIQSGVLAANRRMAYGLFVVHVVNRWMICGL